MSIGITAIGLVLTACLISAQNTTSSTATASTETTSTATASNTTTEPTVTCLRNGTEYNLGSMIQYYAHDYCYKCFCTTMWDEENPSPCMQPMCMYPTDSSCVVDETACCKFICDDDAV